MENSPLELYETAYRLHYTEKRIPEALKYYEALIKAFPESNECGYAVIQIQKIKSNDVAASIAGPKKVKSGPLAFISFILCLLIIVVLAAAGAGVYLLYGEYVAVRDEYVAAQAQKSLAIRAVGKIATGKNEEALQLLDEMKELATDDITPYELAAQLYRRAGLIEQARNEYRVFYRLNPDLKAKGKSIDELSEELIPDLPPQQERKKREK